MQYDKIRLVGLTTVDFPLKGALPTSQYLVKNIDGLGPTEVDVTVSNTPGMGVVYQGRRPQPKEMVMQVGLQPDYAEEITVADLRTVLYGMLTPGYDDIFKVQLVDGADVVAEMPGKIKRIEPVIFSKDPEVNIVISCLETYFQGPELEINFPAGEEQLNVTNEGSAPAGFELQINISSGFGINGLIIYDQFWVPRMEVLPSYTFSPNDIVRFDTRKGQRNVWRTRSGSTITLLGFLSTDFDWVELHGGLNVFHVASGDVDWSEARIEVAQLTYKPQHWGV